MSVSRHSGSTAGVGESSSDMAKRWLDAAELYKREIAIAVAIVIGVVALYAAASHVQEASEEKAWQDIFRVIFNEERSVNGKIADELAKAAEKHKGTLAAVYALMREAEARYDMGDLRRAESAVRDVLERYPHHPLAGQMRLWLGQILLAKGAPQDAQQELEAAVKVAPAYLMPEVRLALAHSLMRQAEATVESAGRKRAFEAALEAYMKVAQEGEAQGWPPQLVQIAAFGRLAAEDRLRELAAPAAQQVDSSPQAADANKGSQETPSIAIEKSTTSAQNGDAAAHASEAEGK